MIRNVHNALFLLCFFLCERVAAAPAANPLAKSAKRWWKLVAALAVYAMRTGPGTIIVHDMSGVAPVEWRVCTFSAVAD
jgi:hypothetical protein